MKEFETKALTCVRSRYDKSMRSLGPPFCIVGLVTIVLIPIDMIFLGGWVMPFLLPGSMVVMLLLFIKGYTRQWEQFQNVNCPECKQVLEPDHGYPPNVVYLCEACCIRWDSGMRWPNEIP